MACDLPGSFYTKRIDRNWLGRELGHAEEETDAGADNPLFKLGEWRAELFFHIGHKSAR